MLGAFLALLVACPAPGQDGAHKKDAGPPEKASPLPKPVDRVIAFDAQKSPAGCTAEYHGDVVDLGAPSSRAMVERDTGSLENVSVAGATWLRVRARGVIVPFLRLDTDSRPPPDVDAGAGPAEEQVYLQVRAKLRAGRGIIASLNGSTLGALRLVQGEPRVYSVVGKAELRRGANEVLLRFTGGALEDGLVDLDWLRVGRGQPDANIAAPTQEDLELSAAAGTGSSRGFGVRPNGAVRCATWIPSQSDLETSLTVVGPGEAEAELVLWLDRAPPKSLGKFKVTRGEWTQVSVPISGVDPPGTLGSIVMRTRSADKGSRVLFGEPRLLVKPTSPTAPATVRNVVVVVLGHVARRSLSPFGGTTAVPSLLSLVESGVTFDDHRATTTIEHGSLASILTGKTARSNTIEDSEARLPKGLLLVPDVVRPATIRTGFFTANPTTSAAFGFDRGWDDFTHRSPRDDVPGVQIFDDAIRWIEAQGDKRFLAIIHARGGHPPWDVSPERLKTLAPPGYGGNLDPRRAGELLAKASRVPKSLGDADRARAWALHANAVEQHDAALGKLLSALRLAGRERDTAVIVTGDVGVQENSAIPLTPSDSLDEQSLGLPLVIRAPGLPVGRRLLVATSNEDLARTITGLLALRAPASFEGVDLLRPTLGPTLDRVRAASAMGHYSLRHGPFVLHGSADKPLKLCNLALDVGCVSDSRRAYPLAFDRLLSSAPAAADARSAPATPREQAELEPATLEALRLWGRLPARKKRGKESE